MSSSHPAVARFRASRPRNGLAVLALALAGALSPPSLLSQTPRVGGFLSLDRRLDIAGDSVLVADFYNRLRPELSVGPSEGMYLFASLDIRAYDFSGVRSSTDMPDPERHYPTRITLWEAYVQLWDFIVDGLDLSVGRQRIQWGTADELNPTDLLNGYDFSDLVNFNDRIPTWAARAEYYVRDLSLTAVWVPTTHAPILPAGPEATLFLGGGQVPDGARITSMDLQIDPPSRRLDKGLVAFKLGGNIAGADYSVSYVSGYDAMPFAKRVDLRSARDTANSGSYAALTTLGFTRARTLGADLATEVAGVGVWAEAALVLPRAEERLVTTTVGATTLSQRQSALDGRAYIQSTLGLDYTFRGGWYANAQWAHGLSFERSTGTPHDYLVARVERSFHQDEVKVVLGGAGEVATWTEASDNLGYGFFPELTYTPATNVELAVGGFVVGGSGMSLFGSWDDADQIYTRVKVSF